MIERPGCSVLNPPESHDEQDQSNHIRFGRPPPWAFPDHVHDFIALNGSPRLRERIGTPNLFVVARRLLRRSLARAALELQALPLPGAISFCVFITAL